MYICQVLSVIIQGILVIFQVGSLEYSRQCYIYSRYYLEYSKHGLIFNVLKIIFLVTPEPRENIQLCVFSHILTYSEHFFLTLLVHIEISKTDKIRRWISDIFQVYLVKLPIPLAKLQVTH